MKIAVLGAGNGGQAFAGSLTLSGHDVHLAAVADHDTQIRVLQTFGGVLVEGQTAEGLEGGFARVARVDTDIVQAVSSNELIILTVPAYAQDVYLDEIAKHAQAGSMVLIQPGKFGALRLVNRLRLMGRDPQELLIGETSTFLYAAKMHGLDRIWLRGVKKELPLAAWPAARTDEMLERLHSVNHQYVSAQNVLATSVDDAAYALHPVSTLLNLSRLEVMGPYRTHYYDLTPQVSRMVQAVDEERCQIAHAFNIHVSTLLEQAKSMYGLEGDSVYEALKQTTVHRDQITPNGADHRYVTEEVPYGLVPMLDLAEVAGIKAPAIEAIVTTASVVNNTDYRAQGRHLDSLGLTGMSVEQILTDL